MNQALHAMVQRAEPWESTRPTRKRDLHARGGVGFSNRVLYSRQPLLKWINSMQFPYAGIGISVGPQSTPAWICIIVKVTQPVKAGTPGFHEVKFSSSVSVWESGDFSTLQLWEERIDHSLLRAVARWLRSCRVLYIVVGTNCSCDDIVAVRRCSMENRCMGVGCMRRYFMVFTFDEDCLRFVRKLTLQLWCSGNLNELDMSRFVYERRQFTYLKATGIYFVERRNRHVN